MKKQAAVIMMALLALPSFVYAISFTETPECDKDAYVLFARGSGQDPGDDRDELDDKPQLTAFINEVGSNISVDDDEVDYPADGELNDFAEIYSRMDAIGTYHNSKEAGVVNAVHTINQRALHCPGQPIVLGGFSQGAHVMGDTLHLISPQARDSIAYVGLFGDPAFNDNSFAARGTYDGWWGSILPQRDEFPAEFQGRVYSFCKDGDGMCEGNGFTASGPLSKHSNYQNHEIPMAAKEAAEKVKLELAKDNDTINANPKLDVVLVYDNTDSHRKADPLDISRYEVEAMAKQIEASRQNVRVGLTAYSDYTISRNESGYIELVDNSQNVLSLSDYTNPQAAYDAFMDIGDHNLYASQHPTVYTGLIKAIDNQNWRSGAQKIIILLTNSQPKTAGAHKEQKDVYAALRNANTPISIHSITKRISDEQASIDFQKPYTLLARNTGGSVYFPDVTDAKSYSQLGSRIVNRLNQVPLKLEQVDRRPYDVGEFVYFGVPEKYDNENFVRWKFDFNGDGVYEELEDKRRYKGYRHNYHLQSDMKVKLEYDDPETGRRWINIKPEIGTVDEIVRGKPEPKEPPSVPVIELNYEYEIEDESDIFHTPINWLQRLVGIEVVHAQSEQTFDLKLSWKKPEDDGGSPIGGYRIYNCQDRMISIRPVDEPYLIITGIEPGELKCVKITALNKYGESEPMVQSIETPKALQSDEPNRSSHSEDTDGQNTDEAENNQRVSVEYSTSGNFAEESSFSSQSEDEAPKSNQSQPETSNSDDFDAETSNSSCMSFWCLFSTSPWQVGIGLSATGFASILGIYFWRRKVL